MPSKDERGNQIESSRGTIVSKPGQIVLPDGVSARDIVEIAQRHGARNVRVFGSFARGDPRPESDLDLLIDLETGRDLFDLVELKAELERQIGRRVDLVTERGLSRYIREDVLSQAIAL